MEFMSVVSDAEDRSFPENPFADQPVVVRAQPQYRLSDAPAVDAPAADVRAQLMLEAPADQRRVQHSDSPAAQMAVAFSNCDVLPSVGPFGFPTAMAVPIFIAGNPGGQ